MNDTEMSKSPAAPDAQAPAADAKTTDQDAALAAYELPAGHWFIVETHARGKDAVDTRSWLTGSIEHAIRLCRRGEKNLWSKIYLFPNLASGALDATFIAEIREAHRSDAVYLFHLVDGISVTTSRHPAGATQNSQTMERLTPIYVQQAW